MDSILLTSPILITLCILAAALHVVEFFLGGKRWLSVMNPIFHIGAILAFLFLEATLLDVLILLMLSTAVCLALRLRRKNK